MLTIDNITTYCHNSKLQLISIILLQKHIRSNNYEIDPFLCSQCQPHAYVLTNGTPYDQCTLYGT